MQSIPKMLYYLMLKSAVPNPQVSLTLHQKCSSKYLAFISNSCVCVCALSRIGHVQLFAIPWSIARQAPLSMGFSRQEQWNGLSFPILGYLPDPEIESASLMSPALADGFFTTEATGETYKAILSLASHLPPSPLQAPPLALVGDTNDMPKVDTVSPPPVFQQAILICVFQYYL